MFRARESVACRAAHAVRAMQGRYDGEARGRRQRTAEPQPGVPAC